MEKEKLFQSKYYSSIKTEQLLRKEIAVVIPTYKEEIDVIKQTIEEIQNAFRTTDWDFEILVINDGSGQGYDYSMLENTEGVKVLEHQQNKGYGAALKTGILHSTKPWIAITDADGTYPNWHFPKLLEQAGEADMIIGMRKISEVPLTRQIPKYILNRYASFLANQTIYDLNSGMRVFKRDLAMQFWTLYPDGFSFTSTITMASIGYGYIIKNVPVEYYKRKGKSSIHPIKDTYRFFKMVGRLGLYFNPLRIFGPIASFLLISGILKGSRDYIIESHTGNLSVSLILAGIQIFLMGLIAEIISKRY